MKQYMKKEEFITLVQEFLIYIHTTLRRSAHTQRAYKADLENFLQFWAEQETTAKNSFQDLVTRYFAHLSRDQKDKKTIARKSSCFYGTRTHEDPYGHLRCLFDDS